jgi:hypothetical protein
MSYTHNILIFNRFGWMPDWMVPGALFLDEDGDPCIYIGNVSFSQSRPVPLSIGDQEIAVVGQEITSERAPCFVCLYKGEAVLEEVPEHAVASFVHIENHEVLQECLDGTRPWPQPSTDPLIPKAAPVESPTGRIINQKPFIRIPRGVSGKAGTIKNMVIGEGAKKFLDNADYAALENMVEGFNRKEEQDGED